MFINPLPKFKTPFECIRHAVDAAEKDGDNIKYMCYGGPAYPTTYSPACYLEEIGIEVLCVTSDEIWCMEDLWADTYNLASSRKEFNGKRLDEILSDIGSFENGKGSWHDCETFKEFLEGR